MNAGSIPSVMKERTQWICWREETRSGELTKVPIGTSGGFASTTDSSTWSSFDAAREAHEGDQIDTDGLGFVFDEASTLMGVDLDDCRDPETGEPTDEAQQIIDDLDSWTEVSPSGTGYHVIVQGFVPDGGNRGDIDDVSHLEMYDKSRYFTVTGDYTDSTPETVEQRVDVVRDLHGEYISTGKETNDDSGDSEPSVSNDVSLEDTELIEKAKNAENGDEFDRLWRGDTSAHQGDHSRADLALCGKLAFWTGGDRHRIDSLFRESGLMRDKWDEQRGEQTYGELTIDKALSSQSDYYDPDANAGAVGDGGTLVSSDGSGSSSNGSGVVLTPSMVRLYAGLDDDESISKLSSGKKAAYVWKLVKESDSVHVRVNRDNDELWAFDDDKGTWSPDGERVLRHAARRALDPSNYTGRVLEEMKHQALADPAVELWGDEFGLDAGKLAVKNGLLDLEKAYNDEPGALRDLEPDDYALTRLPVNYDPDVDKSTWYSFVGEVVDTAKIQTLQEYVGHCLHRDSLYERALLLVGGGANGKSTFLNTIEAALGDENTTSVSPFDFGDKPSLAEIHGSLANISVELDGGSLQGKNLGNFKKLTGGDSIQAKRLYQGPFSFTYDGGMMFATNEVPNVPVSDDDTAFWRRWIIVHFDNQFPEGSDKRDPELGDKLQQPENLSAVLNWAIEGWGRLLEQGGFSNVPERPDTTREQWQTWGDSVDYFLSNVAVMDRDAESITTNEAWEVYRSWCMENGHDFVGQTKFTNAAKDTELGYVGSVRTDRHASPRRGYKFFGTVDEAADPVDVIEGDRHDNDDDNDDDTRPVGLDDYDDLDDDPVDHDDDTQETNTDDGESGDSDPDPKGESGENSPVDGENGESGESSNWSTLLADLTTHYGEGDEITPEGLKEKVDRIESVLYAEKGLEALADDGILTENEGVYVR